eukprot:3625240-Alexandrium_andersonii.AAC.1
MDYRVLNIGSLFYRRWASLRLAHMQAWVDSWALPQLFGGFRGRSAGEASWTIAATLEKEASEGVSSSGLSTDVYKCFDQVPRTLIYQLALRAGAPIEVLRPWRAYLEGLQVFNCLASSAGLPYTKRVGIPQGCPLSM